MTTFVQNQMLYQYFENINFIIGYFSPVDFAPNVLGKHFLNESRNHALIYRMDPTIHYLI